MRNINRGFQDMMDAGDAWEVVEEQFTKTEQYRKAYADWASDDPTATEDDFMATARYEYLLEQYGDDLWVREQ